MFIKYIPLLLMFASTAAFAQVLQETNARQANRIFVLKEGLRLPMSDTTQGAPFLLNYTGSNSRGGMIYDTLLDKVAYWNRYYWTVVGGGGSITPSDTSVFARKPGVNYFTSRNNFKGLTIDKDSIPISATDAWILSLDTIGGANRVQRRAATSFLPAGSSLNVQYRDTSTGLFAAHSGFLYQPSSNTILLSVAPGTTGMPSNGIYAAGTIRSGNTTMANANINYNANGNNSFTNAGGHALSFLRPASDTMTIYLGHTTNSTVHPRGVVIMNGSLTSPSHVQTSAQLEVRSTTKGFLQPRMTTAQITTIGGPATGLQAFDTDQGTNSVYSGDWYQQPNGLKNSATLDFGNTGAQTSADLTITVTGAAVGDIVMLGTPVQDANSTFTAYVSASNTVTVRFNNYSSGSIDPASATFKVYVIKN